MDVLIFEQINLSRPLNYSLRSSSLDIPVAFRVALALALLGFSMLSNDHGPCLSSPHSIHPSSTAHICLSATGFIDNIRQASLSPEMDGNGYCISSAGRRQSSKRPWAMSVFTTFYTSFINSPHLSFRQRLH